MFFCVHVPTATYLSTYLRAPFSRSKSRWSFGSSVAQSILSHLSRDCVSGRPRDLFLDIFQELIVSNAFYDSVGM